MTYDFESRKAICVETLMSLLLRIDSSNIREQFIGDDPSVKPL